MVNETKIGTTTYTIERIFNSEAKESALQAIKRLMLNRARCEEKLSISCSNSLAIYDITRQYGQDTYR